MEIFCVTAPGLEQFLAQEAKRLGFEVSTVEPGGVTFHGDWHDVVHANLELRGATRILARLAEFRAMHLAQLDKRARKLPWADWLRSDTSVRVEATCRRSKIYHKKAAAERVERALKDVLGVETCPDADVTLKIRIEDDLCTISVDTSGDALHKRGLKQQVNKAPMRETLAALFLQACALRPSEPLYDPMCGSGTFPLEAADIAAGLKPGRARSFAYEALAINAHKAQASPSMAATPALRYFGSDRDSGAIAMSRANAERAGLSGWTQFDVKPVNAITPPTDHPGLVIVNPPYGARIGNKKPLFGLYAAFGKVMQAQFAGWRVGLITSDASLAKATDLPWAEPGPIVDHGGLKIRLWQTATLEK